MQSFNGRASLVGNGLAWQQWSECASCVLLLLNGSSVLVNSYTSPEKTMRDLYSLSLSLSGVNLN